MLVTRAAAAGTLQWYIEDTGTSVAGIMRFHITACYRAYLSFLERSQRTLPLEGEARAARAAQVCRAVGAMQSSADETDAEGLTPLMRTAAPCAKFGDCQREYNPFFPESERTGPPVGGRPLSTARELSGGRARRARAGRGDMNRCRRKRCGQNANSGELGSQRAVSRMSS
jgi:hypothetical protein